MVEEARGEDKDEDNVGVEDLAGSPVGDVVCSAALEDSGGSVDVGFGPLVEAGGSVCSVLGFDSGGRDCEEEGSSFVG